MARTIRPLVCLALTSVLLATATACGDDEKPTTAASGVATVKYIQSTDNLTFLPVFVAINKGYFAEERIQLDRQPNLANATQLAQLAASGEVDIGGVGSSGAYSVVAAGRPLKSIGVLCQQLLFQLALNESTVKDLAGRGLSPTSDIAAKVQALKGMTLGVTPQGTLTDVLMRATLEAYGLNPDRDVTLQPLADASSMLAAAKQGRINGFLFPPPTPLSLATESNGAVWIDYTKGEVPAVRGSYIVDLVASPDFLAKNQDVAVRFLRALWKAVKLISEQPAEAAAVARPAYASLDQALYDKSIEVSAAVFKDGLAPTEEGFRKTLELTNKTLKEPIQVTFTQVYATDVIAAAKPA
jgi:NitT/TauT family transport system substrate-binding protein